MPLQEYTHQGITYFVDYRMQQFRTKVDFTKIIEFIDFKTDRGDQILTQMIKDGEADLNRINL